MKKAALILSSIVLIVLAPLIFVQFFPEKALDLALKTERDKAGLVRKELLLEKDLRYVFLEGGKGEPLMLLHGFGANKDNFTRIARFLTPHYRLILPDHTGFGESSRPLGADYSPEIQARRLHALVSTLGISRMHLGGSSMGGQIAMVYARLYPENVESLWLLNPGGLWDGPMTEAMQEAMRSGRNPLIIEKEAEILTLPSLVMHRPPFTPKAFLRVIARERMRNAPLEKEIFKQILARPLTEDIRGLAIPTLIVWGREDRVLHPDNALRLHDLLPRSRMLLMENTGHLPMIEAPGQSAEDYLRFRRTLEKTDAPG